MEKTTDWYLLTGWYVSTSAPADVCTWKIVLACWALLRLTSTERCVDDVSAPTTLTRNRHRLVILAVRDLSLEPATNGEVGGA